MGPGDKANLQVRYIYCLVQVPPTAASASIFSNLLGFPPKKITYLATKWQPCTIIESEQVRQQQVAQAVGNKQLSLRLAGEWFSHIPTVYWHVVC